MNIYKLSKFFTLFSVYQHVTLQQIISNASSLYMTELAGKEPNNFEQVLKLIELKTIFTTNLISLLLQIKSSTNRQVHAQSQNFTFLNGKHFPQFIDKFLKFEVYNGIPYSLCFK